MSRTFVMCKPDAVERKLVGEIIRRLEEANLTIVAAELRSLNSELLHAIMKSLLINLFTMSW